MWMVRFGQVAAGGAGKDPLIAARQVGHGVCHIRVQGNFSVSFHLVLPEFSGRTLAIDTAVAQRRAKLHVPDKRSERDALIAATALAHGMTVVTRNIADFKPMGVLLINPWDLSQ
jgi:hypothetical protein